MLLLTGIAAATAVRYYLLSRSLLTCPTFGCLTRQGIERRKVRNGSIVVFFDVDDMKGANSTFGYEGVNAKIAAAISQIKGDLRHGDSIGRWFSGDEFVVLAGAQNGDEICRRVQSAFKSNGLSVTCAWVSADSSPTSDIVASLSAQVLRMKADRK